MDCVEVKYITEIAQIRKIIGNNIELSMFILRECAEDVGLVSVSDYSLILGVPKRTIQDRLKRESIPHINISGFKFPCVNNCK